MTSIRPASGDQWVITSGDQRAVVAEVGGGLRAYSVGGWDVLDGYAQDEVAPGAAGQILAPWPNRIRDGRYTHRQQAHELALTEPEHHNAAHGLVRWLPWRAEATATDSVQVVCLLTAQPGYPWHLRIATTWSLRPDGLHAEHAATNLSAQPCPFGLGIHPYLRLPESTVDETQITLRARTRLLVDDRLLPIGQAPVAGTDYDFGSPRAIGAAKLDTTFTDLESGGNAVTMTSRTGEHALRVWGDEVFKWWQLFTGDTVPDPRRRRSIAVEPMTCPPNAFRSGTDLITLQPGETWRATWGVTPIRP
ncbi:aldose 1-epimerase [Rhizocola hellebori]|uniref:Aldose 1-epimerase n=1 Tax=Rhizocola hellebori TaxID=1392758 RepID=A0A8J3VEU3_9ACTN|nr:aldose 1-epimerase family protein [Rhizocola hellebori]GIH03612.1 aldose 1-epimerase [Rhizocola hellebori]